MPAIRRLATTGLLTGALLALAAAPALAHVTVSSPDATQGGSGTITFTVPDESETAATTKVTVQIPVDRGIAAVSVLPLPGWTHKETTTKLATPVTTDDGDQITEAVSTVEWTAATAAAGIEPGEYGEFSITAAPLPKAESITFKVLQTYRDGKQVAWIEESVNGAEAEHPAPVLALPAPGAGGRAPAAAPSPASGAAPASSDGTATAALVVGVLGLLAGLAGLGVALMNRRRAGIPGEPAPAGVPVDGVPAGGPRPDLPGHAETEARSGGPSVVGSGSEIPPPGRTASGISGGTPRPDHSDRSEISERSERSSATGAAGDSAAGRQE